MLVYKYNVYDITEAFRAPMFRGGADKKGFSMGAFKNFKEVFGNNPNLWMVPVFSRYLAYSFYSKYIHY